MRRPEGLRIDGSQSVPAPAMPGVRHHTKEVDRAMAHRRAMGQQDRPWDSRTCIGVMQPPRPAPWPVMEPPWPGHIVQAPCMDPMKTGVWQAPNSASAPLPPPALPEPWQHHPHGSQSATQDTKPRPRDLPPGPPHRGDDPMSNDFFEDIWEGTDRARPTGQLPHIDSQQSLTLSGLQPPALPRPQGLGELVMAASASLSSLNPDHVPPRSCLASGRPSVVPMNTTSPVQRRFSPSPRKPEIFPPPGAPAIPMAPSPVQRQFSPARKSATPMAPRFHMQLSPLPKQMVSPKRAAIPFVQLSPSPTTGGPRASPKRSVAVAIPDRKSVV